MQFQNLPDLLMFEYLYPEIYLNLEKYMDRCPEVCGGKCSECNHYYGECKGCSILKGKVFWAAFVDDNGICPIYDCAVNSRGLTNCGECNELPCELYFKLKDPQLTDEKNKEEVCKKVKLLKSLKI